MNTKHYVGRGYQVNGSGYITMELEIDELLEHAVQKGTRRVVRARLAQCLKPSQGMTHTLYVQVPMDEDERLELAYGRVADKQELEMQDLELRELLQQE